MVLLIFSTISLGALAFISLMAGTNFCDRYVPALFVFGDSLFDVGNNNNLDVAAMFRSNFPHYGIDFSGKVSTGRFSNGFNGIDYMAQHLGFKMSPPPYLSITKTTQMMRGVNFASAGSGILDTTNEGTLNTATQIKYFKNTVHALKRKLGTKLAKYFLEKSLYIVGTGNNDMFAYFAATGAANSTDNTQFISDLVDKWISQLTTIYKHGARKFAITGTGYIGCVPYLKNLNPSGDCFEVLNQMSVQFNTVAKSRIQRLSEQLAGFKYSFSDSHDITSTILSSPKLFGFTELESACCGAGNFNGGEQCSKNTTYCSNRDEYFFWDWFHPTQALYNLTSRISLYGSTNFVAPINFKQLAHSC